MTRLPGSCCLMPALLEFTSSYLVIIVERWWDEKYGLSWQRRPAWQLLPR
jgi:hypothetical protein